MITQLLNLQEKDSNLIEAQTQLRRIPLDIQTREAKLKKEEAQFNEKKSGLQALEVEQASLDIDLKTAEEQLVKYKTQQISVKKNDEYQALTKQIADTETKIDQIEEAEIEILIKIDEEKEELKGEQETFQKARGRIQNEISRLKESETQVKTSIKKLQEIFENTYSEVPDTMKQQYDFTKNKLKQKPPFVVLLKEQRCKGCHMKVSNETASDAKSTINIVKCENCGRIVYL